MSHLEWGKIITVFISCAIKPGLAGIPAAVFAFHFTFLETFIVGSLGGVTGIFVFTYLIDGILILMDRLMVKYFPNRKKNTIKFTRTNRFIVKTKKNFGIIGIAIISPPFLSFPLGIFLALKFFGHKGKVISSMCVSLLVWNALLFFIYHAFYDSLHRLFT
jgi:hypothetical protein